MPLPTTSRGTQTFPRIQSVIDKWILHQKLTAPSCHCELVKVEQAPSEARLRQHSPSKGKCAWGCTISLLLAFQLNTGSCWTVIKGKDHLVDFPVTPPQPCCAHTRQSKRPLSVQIIHSRIWNNLLSSLFTKGTTPKEGRTAPPWWCCLWVSCVWVDSTFCTIPTVGILRGGSFLFPPKFLY